MLRTIKPAIFAAAAVAFMGVGCASNHHDADHKHSTGHAPIIRAAEMGADVKEAVAVLHGTKGNEKIHGVVRFSEAGGAGVKVTVEVMGLAPNTEHGFHIHEFGDCSAPDATSAGGHYNPEKHDHGKPGDAKAHVGDMGNIKADASGNAKAEVTLPAATITGKNAILGRGVILHDKPDDYSQPTGNAGGRIACGVIGVAQVKK
jgi:superoxide dismutase, Cu-Zn family